MPASLKRKLAGKEAEVIKTINDCGIGGAMQLYGIKTRPIFLHWIRDNTNGEWKPSALTELSGGEKHKWMGEHRETILDCFEIFGMERTRDLFCLTKDDTLERFIKYAGRPPTWKLTRLERAELNAKEALDLAKKLAKQIELIETRFKIVNEDYRSSRRDFKGHMNQHDGTVEDISQRLSQVFALGLRGFIPLPQRTDPLNIVELVAQTKHQEQVNTSKKKATKTEKSTELAVDTSVEIVQPTSTEPEESPLTTSIEAPPRALKEAYMAAHPLAKSQG